MKKQAIRNKYLLAIEKKLSAAQETIRKIDSLQDAQANWTGLSKYWSGSDIINDSLFDAVMVNGLQHTLTELMSDLDAELCAPCQEQPSTKQPQ